MPAHTHDAPTQPHDNPDLIPVTAVKKAEPRHPLDPLTAGEIEAAREILVSAGLLGETVRVPMLLPDEPTKDELAAWSPGESFDRRVDVTLMDAATGADPDGRREPLRQRVHLDRDAAAHRVRSAARRRGFLGGRRGVLSLMWLRRNHAAALDTDVDSVYIAVMSADASAPVRGITHVGYDAQH